MTVSPPRWVTEGVWRPVDHLSTSFDLSGAAQRLLDVAESRWRLSGCAQDVVFHAEGDVLEHTCRAFSETSKFTANMGAHVADLVACATVLHDVGKTRTSTVVDGRVRAPRHARVGALMVRELLFTAGWPTAERELVCALVAAHTTPPWLLDADSTSAELSAAKVSAMVPWSLLTALARCDVCGRVCDDMPRLVDAVEVADGWVGEMGVGGESADVFGFADVESRLRFFESRSPRGAVVGHRPRCELLVMSGLPGSGKSSWLAQHRSDVEVVSLDKIRESLGVGHGVAEGVVVAEGRRLLRAALGRGVSVAFDATNLRADRRRRVIELGRAYSAEVSVVAVEAPYHSVLERDRSRERSVGAGVIGRLASRWEFPSNIEAHRLLVVDTTSQGFG